MTRTLSRCNMQDANRPAPVIYIVDDDESMREALTLLVRTVGYATVSFSLPGDFLEQYDPARAGCVVLDVRMPQMSGLEVQQHLNRSGSLLPVILITGHADVPMAVQAMKDGAFDFLQKPFREQELIDRVNAALKQDAENRRNVEQQAELRRRAEALTPREREVMAAVVDGKANKVIAGDLRLSERTVEIHRANVMEKMGARSIAHLVKMDLVLRGERA